MMAGGHYTELGEATGGGGWDFCSSPSTVLIPSMKSLVDIYSGSLVRFINELKLRLLSRCVVNINVFAVTSRRRRCFRNVG